MNNAYQGCFYDACNHRACLIACLCYDMAHTVLEQAAETVEETPRSGERGNPIFDLRNKAYDSANDICVLNQGSSAMMVGAFDRS